MVSLEKAAGMEMCIRDRSLPHLAFSEDSIYGITGDSVLGFLF